MQEALYFIQNLSGVLISAVFPYRGGKNQLVIGNPNIDQSFFLIAACDFRNSSGFAIKILNSKGVTKSQSLEKKYY